nr:CinA family protein [Nakamurella lactea]
MTDNPFDALLGGGRLAALIDELTAARLTVATAESLTGGLLTAALTSVPGSSAVVRGGLVVYATDLKHTLAGVDPGLLAAHGPVHPEVAAALADGARRSCDALIGVGLTGVAGPDAQGGVSPGTWFVAAAGPAGLLTAQGSGGVGASDDETDDAAGAIAGGGDASPTLTRHRIRIAAVNAALTLLREHCAVGRR